MEIKTEQDMKWFCEQTKGPFEIKVLSPAASTLESTWGVIWNAINKDFITQGKIGKGSHLQQGIADISYIGKVLLNEIPFLYPSKQVLDYHQELTGPMTGTLSNCFDPMAKSFLFHMRGTNISAPFGFQAAAAGMGVYGQHPAITASLELYQEAGLEKFQQFPRNGLALDILPFMKAGKIPQPLFSFGFLDDLSEFTVCRSLDDITTFEDKTKKSLQEGTLQQKEAYHFTVPSIAVEKVAGELNNSKRFYGPIFESTMNFVRALKDSGNL
jgi:hypothetical protein